MIREENLQTVMKNFWQSLVEANDELNTFISAGMPTTTEKRHKDFVRKWDQMKDKASVLCDQIEKQAEQSVEPIEVVLPWKTDTFKDVWQQWKEYLAEQHNKWMKSRMEYAALNHLKKISEEKEKVAIEYLQFAMANGYPRFFKVTEKNYEQPTTAGGRGDGDF
jgi:hypothetical protein